MSYRDYTDQKLLDLIVEDDKSAFTEIFNRYVNRVFSASMYLVGDELKSKEVVAEVFSKIWMDRASLMTVKDFRNYILQHSKNVAFKKLEENHQHIERKYIPKQLNGFLDGLPDYKLIAYLIVLLLSVFRPCASQNIAKHTPIYSHEKVFLHLDKPSYTAGENIWFNVYLVDATTHKPGSISNVVYVDLFNSKKELLQNRIVFCPDGAGNGDFYLPESLPQGRYIIRAHTNFMRNADKVFFYTKEISVANHDTKQNTAIKFQYDSIDLQFFPEGGELLAGVENRVAFKAINQFGKGMQVKGFIQDESNTIIAYFCTEHNGMGLMKFTPHNNNKYKPVVVNCNQSFTFPAVVDKGYGLKVSTDRDSVNISVYNNYQQGGSDIIYVIGQTRGLMSFDARGKMKNSRLSFRVHKSDLPSGITHITVFDYKWSPLCERMIFINHADQLLLSIKARKKHFDKKEKVELALGISTVGGDAVKGTFSLSVSDNSRPGHSENIVNYLLLSSDLGSKIEAPDYYFDSNINCQRHADLLMMTHGWCRFKWKDILGNSNSQVIHCPEKDIEISGQVLKVGRIPAANAQVTLTSGSQSVFETTTDRYGKFKGNLIHYDSAMLVIQTSNAKGKNAAYSLVLYKKPFNSSIPLSLYPSLVATQGTESIARYRNDSIIPNMSMNKIEKEKTIDLKEIEVKANEIKGEHSYKVYDEIMPITIKARDLSNSTTNVLEEIQIKIAGLVSNKQNELTFLLDGIPVDREDIATFPYSAIESVDVLRAEDGSTNDVVAVNTKWAEIVFYQNRSNGINYVRYPGLAIAREFYSPKYDLAYDDIFDARTTLHWDTNISTDNNGKTTTSFYTSSVASTYKITLQGISDSGVPGYAEFIFSVR